MQRCLLVLSVTVSAAANAATVIGPTYPIAEPDTATELHNRASAVDWKKYFSIDATKEQAFESIHLPRAVHNGSYLFDPTYAIPREITDAKGKVLYPAGYKINVYDRITMPGRVLVIENRAEDLRWLREVAKPANGDKVLLAGGNVYAAREETHLPLYLLDQRFVERFGLRAVPSIVRQEGNRLRVSEYEVH
jgi:conjugal transfer pilus assembly protein TraW